MSAPIAAFDFILPTRVVFGVGAVERLADEIEALGVRRPLLVTDKGLVACGVVEKVVGFLGRFEPRIFDGVEANPKDRNVAEGAAAYLEHAADGVLAVGGGSPIDCAKSIAVLVANGRRKIKEFEGRDKPSKPLPPLVCVPTTAGTGSELTFSSVINDTKNKYKMTIKNRFTAPRTAVCDPELTLTVPAAVTAATGMDALTHAIEAFTATCANPMSDAAALYAAELIYPALPRAFADGGDIDARAEMLMGSMLAGIAFSHSDVASVHCIAEALGGLYDLPHGVCNAVMLPHVMRYNLAWCETRYARLAKAMGLTPDSGAPGALAAVEAAESLAAKLGLPTFASLGVPKSDYPAIAAMSAQNLSTPSNPRPMAEKEYLDLLETMSGKPGRKPPSTRRARRHGEHGENRKHLKKE